ncbi:putative methyltransferase NSUN7 isoform X2 [Tyto alba]|uniref:putative methyltransferase NSUN7 isoform X2 n=1 Tax=Tyto alba TaxID=56313 RepID=UPI0014040A43|nr:putative methyltransferase NSUN7 isoform X2 [Tyto alba]
MPGSKSNLMSLHEDVINDTSDLSEMKISDEKGSVEKRTMTLIEKNGYSDSVYINAAKIFQGIHTEKCKERILVRYGDDSVFPMLTFKDEYSQYVSYELAFSALKYQDLLEEILLDSCVYPCQSIPDELTSLLVVMFYDLQDRKFQARDIFGEEEPVAEVRKIERYLHSFKTKLAATLARWRIKHNALSIEYILPETIRKQEQRASALPLCVWINTFKISLQDVFSDLKKKGFSRVESVSDFDCYTYCMDQHCHDVLFFPPALKEQLLNSDLFADCKLLLQDKSRSLAVHSAQALLNTGDDIIVAHVGSHLTIAHLSALTVHTMSRIFVCGVKSSSEADELRNLFNHMGCKNAGLLRDLFQGSVPEDKLSILAERQLKELMHAMKFNKVQAIVYCTCSVYPEENELVVKKALESGVEGNKVQPYRLIPPVFSTCSNSESSTETFFKMEPSEISGSCFLAVLGREKDSAENVPVKDILARAAAKGLLGGIVLEKSNEEAKNQRVTQATQRGRKTTGGGAEARTAGFLHHQPVPNVEAEVSVCKAQAKNVNRTNGCVQPRKTIDPAAGRAPPRARKHTPHLSPVAKAHERQTRPRKAGAERKRLVLKPVEIVLPPGITPYGRSQRNKPRTSALRCVRGWTGRMFPAPLSKAVRPAGLSSPRPRL